MAEWSKAVVLSLNECDTSDLHLDHINTTIERCVGSNPIGGKPFALLTTLYVSAKDGGNRITFKLARVFFVFT